MMAAMAATGLVAIVRGGGRGRGGTMALGLARAGARVVAAAHIAEDMLALEAESRGNSGFVVPVLADLRKPADCDRVVAEAQRLGAIGALVNNAGLTFTDITRVQFRTADRPRLSSRDN